MPERNKTANTVAMTVEFKPPPPPVGYWRLPGGTDMYYTTFTVYDKPSFLHRCMMEWLMGWKYRAN